MLRGIHKSIQFLLYAIRFEQNRLQLRHQLSQSRCILSLCFSKPFLIQHINDIENKRSRLFPDHRRIPGRKTKYILVVAYLIHAYALMRLAHSKQIIKARAEQQTALQRKTAPFFQSVNDIQYTTLKHRWDLLAKEVLGEEFVKT